MGLAEGSLGYATLPGASLWSQIHCPMGRGGWRAQPGHFWVELALPSVSPAWDKWKGCPGSYRTSALHLRPSLGQSHVLLPRDSGCALNTDSC